MTLAELIAYLEANFKDSEEAKELIKKLGSGLKPTLEAVQAFCKEDPEGLKWLVAEKDRAVTAGIKGYEEKTLPAKIDEATKGLEKAPTETEKRLRELERKDQKREAEKIQLTLENAAIKALAEKGLPSSLAPRMLGVDEESTLNNVKLLEAEIKEAVDKQVIVRLKEKGKVPGGDHQEPNAIANPWKKDTRNLTEQAKIIKTDPEKAKRLAKEAGITLNLESN